jgi:hypothetical protein
MSSVRIHLGIVATWMNARWVCREAHGAEYSRTFDGCKIKGLDGRVDEVRQICSERERRGRLELLECSFLFVLCKNLV